jgi:hypothetical protein
VLIKATLGGGGKGMRLVEKEADFEAMLDACKREAMKSFRFTLTSHSLDVPFSGVLRCKNGGDGRMKNLATSYFLR